MASAPPPSPASLSLWEWLFLLAKIGMIFTGLILKSFNYFKSSIATSRRHMHASSHRSFYHYIAYQGMIDFQCGLTALEKQSLLPTSSKTCESFARRYQLAHKQVTLPDGTVTYLLAGPSRSGSHVPRWRSTNKKALAQEVDNAKRKAKKVIVYFHGGGYAAPILPQNLHLIHGFQKKPHWGEGVIVYILAYSLASEHANPYPTQLREAISLLDHILNVEKFPPSSITLIGNSAGSHLLLGVLLHLSEHPNPEIPLLTLKDSEQLAAAALISPWCSMDTSTASMKLNAGKDIIAPAAIAYWGRNFLAGAAPDPWNTPLIAPAEWWGDLKVNEILLFYGEDEILRDDTAILCKSIQTANPTRTTVHKLQGEGHEQMAMNRLLKLPTTTCESEKIWTAWMKERFK